MTASTTSPSLAPLLARGAVLSLFKRPRPDADFPRSRLVLPGVRVDRDRLAAYEQVCGFPAGYGTLPVTYPHVLGFPSAMALMSRRDFPLPLLGLVHTSIEIEQHRALSPSATYDLTVYAAALAPHRRGTEATVVTEVRTADDLVWESRSTYLARHGTGATTPGPDRETPHEKPGLPPDAAKWRLSGDLGRRYGAASGDRNPIHLHPLTARLFGFPRAIAHGMWTVARCLAEHGTPEAVSVRAEFRAPVLLPATVTYAADGTRFALLSGSGDGGGGGGERLHVLGEVHPLPSRQDRQDR